MSASNYDPYPLEQLGLGTRSYNALKRAGYRTVGQIMDLTVRDLLDVRNLGTASLADIVDALDALDIATRITRLEADVAELKETLSYQQENR